MLFISFLVFGLLLFVMETTLFSLLPVWFGRPDLIFLFIVFLAYRFDAIKGAALVFFIGLLMDIFSGVFVGIYPTVYLLVFFIVNILSKHIANESTFQAPIAIISYLLSASTIFIISAMLAPEALIEWSWRTMLLQVIMLTVIAIPFFSICDLYLTFCTKKLTTWRPFRLPTGGNRFKS